MKNIFSISPKFIIGLLVTLAFRIFTPFIGLANISPLMSTILSGSKAYGKMAGAVYGFLSMFLLDLIMGKLGLWTIITATTYSLIGIFASIYLKDKKANIRDFVVASIMFTLFFDLVTGILMGPILFGQNMLEATIGQIPFTLRHLIGNIVFAIILAPWFYGKIMTNESYQLSKILSLSKY